MLWRPTISYEQVFRDPSLAEIGFCWRCTWVTPDIPPVKPLYATSRNTAARRLQDRLPRHPSKSLNHLQNTQLNLGTLKELKYKACAYELLNFEYWLLFC
jgi:hypothetical protein